jgi:beta-glucosidase
MSMPTDLIARMTLTEKIGQLTMVTADYAVTGPVVAHDVTGALRAGRVGSVFNLFGADATREAQRIAVEETRLGIPLFFGLDVIHGFRTIFPIPIAEAGAFDPNLWEETAQHAAIESAAAGLDLVFAPMLDIARDPRWGRIAEGPGEDPLVGARFAAAKVRGFQGEQLSRVAATAKHFVAYGAATAGRDYASVDVSERALAETYLPPFRAAVDAGVAAIMPAFHDIAGMPLTMHRHLLQTTLRERWGFAGVIMSDYGAIGELIRHGVAADLAEAAALALKAGVDIDMMAYAYEKGLPDALARGLVTMAEIDTAVGRVLDLKERLGLFDDPFTRCSGSGSEADVVVTSRRNAARTAAGKTLVLLKNDAGALPLPASPGRIALIGPLADAPAEMLGPWHAAGRGEEAIGVLAGLRVALPDVRIEHSAGVEIEGNETIGVAAAARAAQVADHVILCLGEAEWMSGEAACRARIDLPGRQAELADAVLAAGKPVIVLLFSGRPITMPAVFAKAAAVVACWFPGSEAGHAIADLLTGRINPSARLAVSWPRHVGQVPIFYSQRSSGRPENPADKYTSKYLDMPNAPQFAFGHGVSYTRFSLTEPIATAGETVTVETVIRNEGDRAGETPVFVFIRDPVARVARPVLELKRFERVALEPGEQHPLAFRLERADFAFPGVDLEPVIEPGEIEIHVGFSAAADELRTTTVRIT